MQLFKHLETNVLDHLSLIHWQAAILCPETKSESKDEYLKKYKAKNQRVMDKFNRYDEALAALRERVKKVVEKTRERERQANQPQQGGDADEDEDEDDVGVPPPRKKQRLMPNTPPKSRYVSRKKKRVQPPASPEEHRNTANAEIDEYLRRPVKPHICEQAMHNPIGFWLDNEGDYPHLSQVALQIMTTPAMSAAVERLFSFSGRVVDYKRLRMTAQHLGQVCKLKKRKKEFKDVL